MKRYIFILTLFSVFAFSSCEIETSDNGDLDGFWHMVSVDTLDTGGRADYSEKLIFWSVQHKLLQLNDRTGAGKEVLCRFAHYGDSLRIYSPHEMSREPGGDIPLTDSTLLLPYGINSIDEHFKVEVLNNKNMVLKTHKIRLTFKKM